MHNSENSQTSKYNIQKLSQNNLIYIHIIMQSTGISIANKERKNKNEQERKNFRLEETFVPFALALQFYYSAAVIVYYCSGFRGQSESIPYSSPKVIFLAIHNSQRHIPIFWGIARRCRLFGLTDCFFIFERYIRKRQILLVCKAVCMTPQNKK